MLDRTASTDDAAVGARILSVIQRVETKRDERKAIDDDIKDIFAEAKGTGLSVAAIKELIKERAIEGDASKKSKRDEHDVLVDLYRRAIEAAS